ncbi:autoinducer binding domain-containing protein [Rhizobiaceae bacterium n13]|uniref:Autoinducer binding domain-containing protein n=1 Tax=Ferirhizobium litorale TaxID=2927786 RepID=A0AAE3QFE9_9HYPH|nr:autoinducer binding domain-containing protein [Fererhizobium litorale]MDI7922341.1 autoinducer binding domain-containing protein [Fererhizobium litorale]
MGCRHVAHVYAERKGEKPETYISVTYPARWLLNYALRNYFAVDPVVNYGQESGMVVLLNEVADQNAPLKAMINDARSFGVGKSFLAVSAMPYSEYRGAVLFTFDVEPEAMKVLLEEREEKIIAAARHLHVETLKARGLVTSVLREFQLSRLELRCLSLMAHGVSSAEIAGELGIPADQLSSMLADLCQRLGCINSMQLISRAISLGLVNMFDDVMTPPHSGSSPRQASPARPN